MSKLFGILAAAFAVATIVLGILFFHTNSKVSDMQAEIQTQKTKIAGLEGQVAAAKQATEFKETEVTQTNILLDECYKVMASSAKEFDDIDQIMRLPSQIVVESACENTKEEANVSSPQNTAAIDFINQQLSAVD